MYREVQIFIPYSLDGETKIWEPEVDFQHP